MALVGFSGENVPNMEHQEENKIEHEEQNIILPLSPPSPTSRTFLFSTETTSKM
jgi:hypothetical protein